jgi:serine/threonine protein kinase
MLPSQSPKRPCPYCPDAHAALVETCPATGLPLTSRHDPASHVGQVIDGRYHVGEQLGRGGFAVVHAATCLRSGQSLAIKMLNLQASRDPVAIARLRREGEVAGTLRHPNIRTVHHTGTLDNGTPYLVMNLLAGETLLERLARRRFLPVDDAIEMMARVLSGLGAAHDHRVLHRDVSPSNIFLTRDDSLVKLFDFGMSKRIVASRLEGEGESMLTTRGVVVGTLQYTAPEQVRGLRDLDGRADLFSAGAVLYFALTGQRPFRGPDLREVLRAILSVDPPPASELRPELPTELDLVLSKAMARDRDERFGSAAEFRQALLDLRHRGLVRTSMSEAPSQSQECARPGVAEDELTPLEVDLHALSIARGEHSACTRLYAPEVDALIDGGAPEDAQPTTERSSAACCAW